MTTAVSKTLAENDQWLLSFYRTSEIAGSLFFGRLASTLKSSAIQHDMTQHFADEAQHAWYWTKCLSDLDSEPIKVSRTYQDQYLEACGIPSNIMEVLAITLTFERRVIFQYQRHANCSNVAEPIIQTIGKIMEDEKWHVEWVSNALKDLGDKFGHDTVKETLARYKAADAEVYAKTLEEFDERLNFLYEKVGRDD